MAMKRKHGHSARAGAPRLAMTLAAALLTLSPLLSNAAPIEYQLTALGGNSYRYTYSVTNDGSFGAGGVLGLFDIAFDPVLYLEPSLTIRTPAGLQADWSEVILPSAPLVPAFYDVLALSGGLGVGQGVSGFAVEFEWLGAGTPGAQAFEIFDPATFAPLATGITVLAGQQPVPEPGTLWILLGALGLLAGLRKGATVVRPS